MSFKSRIHFIAPINCLLLMRVYKSWLLALVLSLIFYRLDAQDPVDLAFLKQNPSILEDSNTQTSILKTTDSLFAHQNYKEMVQYLEVIDSLFTSSNIPIDPLMKARFLYQTSRGLARLKNVTKVYLKLQNAEAEYQLSTTVDTALFTNIVSFLSSATRRLGLYEEALKYGQKWASLVDEKKSPLEMAEAYNVLGLAHSRLFNKKSALAYYMKCYDLRSKVAPEWLPFVMNNIGETYYKFGHYDSASIWFQKAYNFKHPRLDESIKIHSVLLANLSNIDLERMQLELAISNINKAISILGKYEDLHSPAFRLLLLQKTKILIETDSLEESIYLLDSLEAYWTKGNDPDFDNQFYRLKAEINSKRNRFDSAIIYTNKALVCLDSGYNHSASTYELPNYISPLPDLFHVFTLKYRADLFYDRYKSSQDVEMLQFAISNVEKAIESMSDYIYRQPNAIGDPEVYKTLKDLLQK